MVERGLNSNIRSKAWRQERERKVFSSYWWKSNTIHLKFTTSNTELFMLCSKPASPIIFSILINSNSIFQLLRLKKKSWLFFSHSLHLVSAKSLAPSFQNISNNFSLPCPLLPYFKPLSSLALRVNSFLFSPR